MTLPFPFAAPLKGFVPSAVVYSALFFLILRLLSLLPKRQVHSDRIKTAAVMVPFVSNLCMFSPLGFHLFIATMTWHGMKEHQAILSKQYEALSTSASKSPILPAFALGISTASVRYPPSFLF
jgi:hypothetical protein